MTETQGTSLESENVDEVSINTILETVRSSKGNNSNLATAVAHLNKREARNFTKLETDVNNLGDKIIESLSTKIESLSSKIDDATAGIKAEVATLNNRLNTVDQTLSFLNQKAPIIDANKVALDNLTREYEEFKANPPLEFINRVIKKAVVKIVGPAYARELRSLNKVLEISKLPQDDSTELNAYDRVKKYVIDPLDLAPALYNDTLPTDVSPVDTTDGSEKFHVTFKTSKSVGNIFKNINGKPVSASINKIVPEEFRWKHDSFKRRAHAMKYLLDGEGRSVRKGRVDFKEGVLNLYAKDKVGLADYGPEYIVDSFFPELDTAALIPADDHLKMQYKGIKIILADPVDQGNRAAIESIIRQHAQVLNCKFLNSGYACIITYEKNATADQISAAYHQEGVPRVKRVE